MGKIEEQLSSANTSRNGDTGPQASSIQEMKSAANKEDSELDGIIDK